MTPPGTKGKHPVRINAFTQAKLIKLLLRGEFNCRDLAEQTGLHYSTVLYHVRELHRCGAAFIHHYLPDQNGHDRERVFCVGFGTDATRYKVTEAERAKRYRAERKQLATQRALTSVMSTK